MPPPPPDPPPLLPGGVGLPLEMTRLTAEPLATVAPVAGVSLITLPERTVALDCMLTVPTVSPAPVIVLVAAG